MREDTSESIQGNSIRNRGSYKVLHFKMCRMIMLNKSSLPVHLRLLKLITLFLQCTVYRDNGC